MRKVYLYSFVILLNNCLFAQGSQIRNIKYFCKSKDSIISEFLSSRIDTANYRCAYQESSGIYIFISQKKCYLCSKTKSNIDSLSDKFIFEMPKMQTFGQNKIDSLIKNNETEYSWMGSFYYFEKCSNANIIYFYSEFPIFMKDKETSRIGNDLFSLFGFAKIKLGRIPPKKKEGIVTGNVSKYLVLPDQGK